MRRLLKIVGLTAGASLLVGLWGAGVAVIDPGGWEPWRVGGAAALVVAPAGLAAFVVGMWE